MNEINKKSNKAVSLAESLQSKVVDLLIGQDPEVINLAMCCLMVRAIQATTKSEHDAIMLARKNAEFVIKNVNQL